MIDVEETSRSRLLTRRTMFKGAAGAAGLAALGGAAFGTTHALDQRRRRVPGLHSFANPPASRVLKVVSQPDLNPPNVAFAGGDMGSGCLFLGTSTSGGAHGGPLIVDGSGEPVWFRRNPQNFWASNVRRQYYRGQFVLTWWEGRMTIEGFGRGEGVIMDSSYREIARVRAGNGRSMDMHEFLLTSRGTALFVCYPETVPADLSSIGGPSNGSARQSVIQEVDVRSGRLLFEWRSLEHVSVDESYQRPAIPFDYLHVNSIDVLPDGNLLVSARCTWALYKLDRKTGEVIWRLGGKRSDFELGDGAEFSWQHDARSPTASTITVFDDGNAGFDDGSGDSHTESQSRGVVLQVDEKRRTARLARSYSHPQPLLADAMGSFQTLPDGHVVIGWGSVPVISEFSADGRLLADWRVGSKQSSYRAYRYPWVGRPSEPPALAARRTGIHGQTLLFASWNGATEYSHWLVYAGRRPGALRPVGVAKRRGFETVIPLGTSAGYFRVTALDAHDRRLASSETARL
ncbi:MAG: arylsulfotransferase family protein [Solirubrobacteraceae bacterium]